MQSARGSGLALFGVVVQLQLRLAVPAVGGDEFVEALRSVLRPAKLDRECLAVRVLRDVDEPGTICCLEEWPSEAAAARRVKSELFSQLLGLTEVSPSRPSLEFRFVSDVRGLEYVEAVRSGSQAPPPEGKE